VKVGKVLKQLYDAEAELADEFRKVRERHAVEHDVFHIANRLSRQCQDHMDEIRAHAARYDAQLAPTEDPDTLDNLMGFVRRKNAELLGRREEVGMLLLRDLRQLYLLAQEVAIDWVLVGQCAQAARDRDLLELTTHLHEETVTQIKWIKTKLKQSSPQVLVAG
jgi:hypothetical protein